jgi:serine/threonine protein kinase
MFGPYRLVTPLGRGGMGEVWRAVDIRKNREVAVKILGSWLAQEPNLVSRFRREAALAARLSAPHIIPIHDFGQIEGRLYIEMPLIEGVDLAALLEREGPLSLQRCIDVLEQIADGLDTAHAAGLVHRDVKPSNVLISPRRGGRDHVYLIDFGIARAAGDTSITTTGQQLGTLAYMAPERFTGGGDHRSDVYSLTCLLHAALTGRAPFTPQDGYELGFYVYAHLNASPPRPSDSNPAIPPALDGVIATGMAKNPDERYPDAGSLAAAAGAAVRSGATADTGAGQLAGARVLAPAGASGSRQATAVESWGSVSPEEADAPTTPVFSSPPSPASTTRVEPHQPNGDLATVHEPPEAAPSTGLPLAAAPSRAGAPRHRKLRSALVIAVVLAIVAAVGVVAFRRFGPLSVTNVMLPTTTAISLSATPDGSRVLIADYLHLIDVDTVTNTVRGGIEPPADRWNPYMVASAPDGRHAYAAGDRLWTVDLQSNQVVAAVGRDGKPAPISLPEGDVTYLEQDTTGLAVGSQTGRLDWTFPTSAKGPVTKVVSLDATGHTTRTLSLDYTGGPAQVRRILVSPDGLRVHLLSRREDPRQPLVGLETVADMNVGDVNFEMAPGRKPDVVDGITPTSGKRVYTTTDGGPIVETDESSGLVLGSIDAHSTYGPLAVSADGHYLYAFATLSSAANPGPDEGVRIFDTQSHKLITEVSIPRPPGALGAIAMTLAGNRLYILEKNSLVSVDISRFT